MSSVEGPRATRREWLGLAVIALPCLLYAMDHAVLNLALPTLTADLQPTASQLLWIVDIYGFFLAGSLLTMGTLGDRIGRRKLLLIGAACFGLVSILAAFAQTAEMLIFARALLGIAGATLAPSTLSLISNMFPNDRERTFAISIWVASFSAGAAIGPVLGGIMLAYFWWGSVFLVSVPIMVLVLILGPFLLPEYKAPEAGKLDLVSAALSVIFVLSIIYGIKQLAEGGDVLVVGGTVVLGLAVGAIFVRRQTTLAAPLLDLGLFAKPAFSAALAINVLVFFAALGSFLLIAQYLQLVIGLSPLEAGLWSLPSGLGFVVGSLLISPLLKLMRTAHVLTLGLGLATAGFVLMTQLRGEQSLILLVVAGTLLSLGMVPCAAIAADLVVGAAPPERSGSASGLNETSSEFGGALGIALLGSLVTALYRYYLDSSISADIPSEATNAALRGIGAARSAAKMVAGSEGAALLEAALGAFNRAVQITAACCALIVSLAALIAIPMFRKVRPAGV